MALLVAMIAGALGGYVLGLTLDYAYREESAPARAGLGRPARRRLVLLPPAGAAVVILAYSSTSGLADLAGTSAVAFILLALAATDFERHLLPNRLLYPAIPFAVALAPWLPAGGYVSSMLGALLGFVVLLVPYIVARGALGAGDVKLGALVGAFAGAWLLLPALTIGAALGAIGCLVLLVRRRTRRLAIAYGPYLVLGALLVPLT